MEHFCSNDHQTAGVTFIFWHLVLRGNKNLEENIRVGLVTGNTNIFFGLSFSQTVCAILTKLATVSDVSWDNVLDKCCMGPTALLTALVCLSYSGEKYIRLT